MHRVTKIEDYKEVMYYITSFKKTFKNILCNISQFMI
jgi:hypothetical protein